MRSEIFLEVGFRVQRYAEIIGFHRSTIYRRFMKTMGISPKRFCTQEQLKMAKKLLLNLDIPIFVISRKLGFSDPLYFSKWFKSHLGISPSKYRKEVVKRGDNVPFLRSETKGRDKDG